MGRNVTRKLTDAEVVSCFSPKEKIALRSLIAIVGDDTDTMLNYLHSLAARVAILAGVEPEDFAAGVKAHWDAAAEVVNALPPGSE
ncbi:hypothetical protein [Amorphus sp. MBR-141]